jgi:hypothetical protein
MSDDLMTAYLVGFHKRDDEFAAVTLTKDETIRLQADEIERLRWLLRDFYDHESLNDLSRLRVREALGYD